MKSEEISMYLLIWVEFYEKADRSFVVVKNSWQCLKYKISFFVHWDWVFFGLPLFQNPGHAPVSLSEL